MEANNHIHAKKKKMCMSHSNKCHENKRRELHSFVHLTIIYWAPFSIFPIDTNVKKAPRQNNHSA